MEQKLEGIPLNGNVYIRHIKDVLDNRNIFNVYYQENKIASFKVSFANWPDFNGYYISDANVLENFRRKGIASKAYDFIEKHLSIKLQPSPMYQTQDGKNFWKNRNGFKNWLANN